MRRTRIRHWLKVVGGLGLLGLAGCETHLQEAALAGLYDFVAGTVGDTLSTMMPIADAVVNGVR